MDTVLFSNEELLLLRREVAPPQLILTDPSEDFFSAFKRERHGGERDFGMLLNDFITIVAVNKGITPDNQRRNQLAFFQDVFSTMPLPFESREEVLAWICKNQLGRRNLTPEQKKFLIGKQYSMEHRKPGGNGNNQHTAAAKKTAPEELCQIDTIPPTSAEASIRKQIAERNNVSESYVARSEKFMRGVEIMEQMVPGMQEKILSGQFKVRDADMHRLARADFPNRKQIVHEILHPEDRPAPQSSYSHYSGINYSALEVAVRRIQQDFDFLMRYLPKLPDDSYAKTETLKILKQHKAYMAQFEEMLNEKEIT